MKIRYDHGTLTVIGLTELGAANAHAFRDETCEAAEVELEAIEIDLSQTSFVDSWGLGALVALYKSVSSKPENAGVPIRLLNPLPPVQQVLELTRMHHLFEIVQRPEPTSEPGEQAKSIQPAAEV